jgi:hypothetical protein
VGIFCRRGRNAPSSCKFFQCPDGGLQLRIMPLASLLPHLHFHHPALPLSSCFTGNSICWLAFALVKSVPGSWLCTHHLHSSFLIFMFIVPPGTFLVTYIWSLAGAISILIASCSFSELSCLLFFINLLTCLSDSLYQRCLEQLTQLVSIQVCPSS